MYLQLESHLQNLVTRLENNNMLHPEILLNEVHPLSSVGVLESVFIVTVEPIHDVALEVLQQVDLCLEIFWILRDSIILSNVDCTMLAGRYIIKMTVKRQKSNKQNNGLTDFLSGDNTSVVLSLKCTPTDPSVNAYPIPYLLQ